MPPLTEETFGRYGDLVPGDKKATKGPAFGRYSNLVPEDRGGISAPEETPNLGRYADLVPKQAPKEEKPSIFSKAKDFTKDTLFNTAEWLSKQNKKNEKSSLTFQEIATGKAKVQKGEDGKPAFTSPRIEEYKKATTEEEKAKVAKESEQDTLILRALNSTVGKKITGQIYDKTSNIPLKVIAAVKAIGDGTYDEAYKALVDKSKDPNNPRWKKILYGLQDSGVQSAIGALLSVGASYITKNPAVGKAVSASYFAPISAEGQRREKGKVESVGNIAIDTIGDTIISGFAESALKNVAKESGKQWLANLLKNAGKGFLIEGTTEPTQTFLKYANDYNNAKTEAERGKVVAQLSQYVKDGGMVNEFLIGGLSGAGITAGATVAGRALGSNVNVEPNLITDKPEMSGEGKAPEETVSPQPEAPQGQFGRYENLVPEQNRQETEQISEKETEQTVSSTPEDGTQDRRETIKMPQPDEEEKIFFHGTTRENAEKIVREGFRISEVSLTPDREEAGQYGDTVIEVRLKKNARVVRPDTSEPLYAPEDARAVGISEPKIQRKKTSEAQAVREQKRNEELNSLQKEIVHIYQDKKEDIDGVFAGIATELELSRPGSREQNPLTGEWTGVPSTFPDWIPEHLRSKELFDKVFEGLDPNNIRFPEGNRSKQRDLYNALLEEADFRLGVDTKQLRDNIIKQYEKGDSTEEDSGSSRRGEINADEIQFSRRAPAGGQANLATTKGGQKTIRKILERSADRKPGEPEAVPPDFKISDRARQILEEFGIPSGEKELSSRYLGLYKPRVKKVRVQAYYDITTVVHEAIHAIDDQVKFSKRLIESTGPGAQIRKQLTDIYEDLYPGGKRTHKLEKRIQEGLAVLFENYFYDPVATRAAYPDLVSVFIKPTGRYYNNQFSKLLERMNELVEDYAKLSPEDRIASRVRTGKEIVDKDTGFSRKQRVVFEVFNRFEPLKRYANKAGVSETWDDPVIQAFNILNKNSIVYNWVKGKVTPILLFNGDFKIEEGTVADYLKLTKGREKEFRSFLVARRVFEAHNNLNALQNEYQRLGGDEAFDRLTKLPEGMDESNKAIAERLSGSLKPEIVKIREKIQKISSVIENDDFSSQDATAVVQKYGGEFEKAVKIYDDINRRLIDVSEENDLIDKETADTYRAEKGYASFKRYIDDELDSLGTIKTSSKSKVSSFMERTGSQLDIIDPVYSQIMAINEVMSKAMENRLWTKVDKLAQNNPEIGQRFEPIEPTPAVDANGKVSFPQERDPNIIRLWVGGKRQFRKAGPEFLAVMKTLRGKEQDLFVKLLRVPTSIFTRFTTSANPFFAAGNFSVDQVSALTQTKTGFKPIADPAKGLFDFLMKDDAAKAYIAIGGRRQTLASYFDLSPDDIVKDLGGKTGIGGKIVKGIDQLVSVLEIPSNASEIMTRYSEFARSLERGEPMSVAMYRATEVTTPFQLSGNFGGRLGQEYIRSIPYLNAIIQVLYKFARTTKGNPTRVITVAASLLVAGLTSAIISMKYSTEKQKRLLSQQPARNLSRYIYIPSPNGDDYFRLRIPEQFGAWTGLAYLYVIQNYEGNKATFNDYLDAVSSAVPEQINITDPKKLITGLLPQAIKPFALTALNMKTYPEIGPIVPPFVSDRAAREQYNAYTSEAAKSLGKLLNISPMKIDFFVKNQFGAVGNAILGKLPSNSIYLEEEEYVMSGRSYNRFYENRKLVQQQYDEMTKYNTDQYSFQDKANIKLERQAYDKVADILADMRKINQTKELPESIRSSAYELLLKMDATEDVMDVQADASKLRSEVNDFMAKNRIK